MARDQKICVSTTLAATICDEIGERLRESLGGEAADMPPYQRRLVDRLGELDTVSSPGIVALIGDLQSSRVLSVLEPV